MKMLLSFLMILVVASHNNALCNEVTFLPKGSVTKFDGFLFPEQNARDIRIKLLEHDLLKVNHEFLSKQLEAKDKIYTLQKEQIDILSNKLERRENMNKYESMLWFTLGAIITGIAAKGLSRN